MGGINILVNNAAYQMVQKTTADLSYEHWHKPFNINIHPFFYLSKMALPHMKPGDTVINNASINAYIGRPDLLDYTSHPARALLWLLPEVSRTNTATRVQESTLCALDQFEHH